MTSANVAEWQDAAVGSRGGEACGRALMERAERIAREDGHTELGLNVLGRNAVARGLWASLGYETTRIRMRKPLRSNSLP
jgi:ribosomal protein S18 acetylase RimI-like enzyme